MIQVVRQFSHKERSMDMAQTTKNAIRKGFLDLLEQRPLDKISVVDIADHCGVNRNTFYYYYCDIYALIRELMELVPWCARCWRRSWTASSTHHPSAPAGTI